MKRNFGLMALTGILTLASCGQGPSAPTDTTPPTVSLTASTTKLTAAGDVTLTANASDAESAITKVEFYRGSTLIASDDSAPFTTSDKLTANGDYSYTAKAYNAASKDATSAPVTVTVAIPSTGGGTGGGTPSTASITITSPANNTTVSTGKVDVAFNMSKALTDVVCTVNGQGEVKANVGSTSGVCTIDVSAVNGTTANIVVSGKDGSSTVQANSFVKVALPGQPTVDPRVVNGIAFDAGQELKASERGLIGETKVGGKWQNIKTGWRYFGQLVSTPSDPSQVRTPATYVKGKDLKVSFTAANATDSIEVFYARTTGSDVPTNDDMQAARKIKTGTGKVDFVFDTTMMGEFEATYQWIVVRVNGTQLFSRPVISDNHAPQPAVPALAKGDANQSLTPPRSNILPGEPYYDVVTKTRFTWANGNVDFYTTNTQLEDNIYGSAPVGANPTQRIPIGFESITYYLVPDAEAIKLGTSDADGERRADMVRQYATAWTAPIKATQDAKDRDYRIQFDSVNGAAASGEGKIVEGTLYRVYAITRDLLGNEVASPTYKGIKFDNVGPSVSNSGLCDISPLPYVSTEPCKYISDLAGFNRGVITGTGAPFDSRRYNVSIGGTDLIRNGVLVNDGVFDTNVLADGEYSLNFLGLTDVLGNPATGFTNTTIYIDNTDPEADLHAPTNGVYNSGERISVESLGKDAQQGASGVYQNLLFWDDQLLPIANKIGKPVEFGRATAGLNAPSGTLSANRDLLAPFNPATGNADPQRYYITNLVIDRAGNATMARNTITVKPKYSGLKNPSLGAYDAADRDFVLNPGLGSYMVPSNGGSNLYPLPGRLNNTPLSFNWSTGTGNARLSVAADGTGTINSGPTQIPSQTAAESLKAVSFHGQYDAYDWRKISAYQVGDRSVYDAESAALRAMIEAQQTERMRRAVYQLLLLGLDRAGNFYDEDITLLGRGTTGYGFNEALIRALQDAYTSEGVIRPFTPDQEGAYPILSTPGNVLKMDRAQLQTVLAGTEANQLILDMMSYIDNQDASQTVLNNLYNLYVDPSLVSQPDLGTTRTTFQGWGTEAVNRGNYTKQPWTRLGESTSALGGQYALDTDMVNNLYFMQDGVANSVPAGTYPTYTWLNQYYRTVGVSGVNDAATVIAQDTAGTYNAAGEARINR